MRSSRSCSPRPWLSDQDLERSAAYLELAEKLAATVLEARSRQVAVTLAVVTLVLARWRGDLETVLKAMQSVEAGLEALEAGERALTDELRSAAFENLGGRRAVVLALR